MDLLRNTTYNPMIYITFFIVILIDKRGVREAERLEYRYEYRYEYPPPLEKKR